MPGILETAFLVFILVFFSFLSYRKKSLDKKGILIANIIGLLVFFLGGIIEFLAIVVFFAVAELSTRYARQFAIEKHETRTISNILGNSLAAVIALALNSQIGFFGAISAALADTLSSEIGLLSKTKPVLITNFREVEPGTNGGITILGCNAAFIGGLVIGIPHYLIFFSIPSALAIIAAGVFGSLIDSVLGALFEQENGKKLLNNAGVNFFASAAGAVLAAAIVFLF